MPLSNPVNYVHFKDSKKTPKWQVSTYSTNMWLGSRTSPNNRNPCPCYSVGIQHETSRIKTSEIQWDERRGQKELFLSKHNSDRYIVHLLFTTIGPRHFGDLALRTSSMFWPCQFCDLWESVMVIKFYTGQIARYVRDSLRHASARDLKFLGNPMRWSPTHATHA